MISIALTKYQVRIGNIITDITVLILQMYKKRLVCSCYKCKCNSFCDKSGKMCGLQLTVDNNNIIILIEKIIFTRSVTITNF